MLVLLELLARFFAAPLELAVSGSAPIAALAVVGAVGMAAVTVALCVGLLAVVLAGHSASVLTRAYLNTIDVSRSLSQSDPNAAGRPRPRAPGRDLSVA